MNCDQKLTSKLSQKKVILNGKSEKITEIDQKSSKKHTFLRNSGKKRGHFSHKELTPPKCLPWEWTMVGKSGQKRALSLRYPLQN